MHKFFFGLIILCFYLSEPIIVKYNNQSSILRNQITQTSFPNIFPNLIPATSVKNQNWNEYIVISGNIFAENLVKQLENDE